MIAALAALVVAVAIFAGGFIAARVYFGVGAEPADVVIVRWGVAAVVTLPILVAHCARLSRDPGWWRAGVLGIVGGAPFGWLVTTGVAGAPVVHGAAVTPGVALIWGTLLSYVALNEPLGWIRLAGLAITLAGLIVLVWPELLTGEAAWWAEAAYVAAGVLWGSFTVALRGWRIGALDGAMLASVFSLPWLCGYIILYATNIPSLPIAYTIGQALYNGILFNVIAVMLYAWGTGRLGAIAGVAAMPLMPVFGALMEWAILHRAPHMMSYVGMTMITTGVAVAILRRNGAR